jgi:uncharacterized phiE125 gp8 family phage protein
MEHKTGVHGNPLHSLIPLEDFKAILGIDDREDTLSRYCLMTATFTIEQYCRRRLCLKQYHELIESYGDMYVPLREYPVQKVLAVYAYGSTAEPELIEPGCYSLCPEIEERLGIPYTLRLSPTVGRRLPGVSAFKAVYRAGYAPGTIPADLASACLELAAWNMSRYRGKRIGMTGNIRGSGKDGEHLEASMPENVMGLLEPYRRRTI